MSSWNITELILAVLFVIQLVGFCFLVVLHRRTKTQQKLITKLRQEQQAIVSGNRGLGRKLFQFKNNLVHLEQSQVEIEQSNLREGGFEQAAKMLKKGVSIDDVADSCQISVGEAELLQQMLATSSFH